MNEIQAKQVEMHQDFFDHCKLAIDQGFYMEAILMEYAAIESRLEIILGVVGLPCNKNLDPTIRRKINISHRVACLKALLQNSTAFSSSKLDKKFCEKLKKWVDKRNQYIHGLYKNELVYKQRLKDAKEVAEQGYEFCRLLYNEAHRLRRLVKKNPNVQAETVTCHSANCLLNRM